MKGILGGSLLIIVFLPVYSFTYFFCTIVIFGRGKKTPKSKRFFFSRTNRAKVPYLPPSTEGSFPPPGGVSKIPNTKKRPPLRIYLLVSSFVVSFLLNLKNRGVEEGGKDGKINEEKKKESG